MRKNRSKEFKQQHYINMLHKNQLVRFKCHSCNEEMGLSMDFILKYRDLNYKYICPYCGLEGKISEEND